jgi:hypothetical protein
LAVDGLKMATAVQLSQIVGTVLGGMTLAFTVFVFLRVGIVAGKAEQIVAKTEEIHASAIGILKQTNGIMERSEAKTEIIAHAAGVQEGLSQHLGSIVADHISLAPAAATAAALVLDVAAQAAKTLEDAVLAQADTEVTR